MKWKIWKKQPSNSYIKNFPPHKSIQVYCRDVISLVAAGIAGIYGLLVGSATAYGVTGFIVGGLYISFQAIATVLVGAAALAASALTGQNRGQSSIPVNGQLINTRDVSEPVKVVYGRAKVGGNWVFCQASGTNNKYLNLAMTWSEGECDSIAKAVDQNPTFSSKTGLNDLKVAGTYSGTDNVYKVQIEHTGTPDQIKWSDDNGATWEATDINITGAWQDLNNGVKIKFNATTGHTVNNYWTFDAGDGVWLGESLYKYYVEAGTNLVTHTFYTGTSTQTVDAGLQADCPQWNDAMRNTCYSIFKLRYAQTVFKSVPEIYILLKGRKLYDPRDLSTIWSRNPALVWRDFMTNTRYGLGISTSLIDDTSVGTAATWCDNNSYYFDGCVIDRKPFIDNLEDILANFRAFVVWCDGKYYLKIYTDDAAVMTLTTADIEIKPESFGIMIPGIPETPNRVKCIFADPNIGYTANFASHEDLTQIPLDGDPREVEMALIGTSGFSQAKKLAKYYLLRARQNKSFTLLCHPRTFALSPGDMIQITHEYTGWSAYKLRVKSVGLPQEGLVPLELMDEATAIYDQTINVVDQDPYIPITPPVSPDTPTNCTASTAADTTTAVRDAYIQFTWDDMGVGLSYELEYMKTTSANWSPGGMIEDPGGAETTITKRIGKLPTGIEYAWRVRTILPDKSTSDWAAPVNITTWGDVTAPAVPTGLALVVNYGTIHATVNENTADVDWKGNEFHFSTVTGFTPNDAGDPNAPTLKDQGAKNTGIYKVPTAGTWYCKVIAYDMTGNESAACAQVSCVVANVEPVVPGVVVQTGEVTDKYIVTPQNYYRAYVTCQWQSAGTELIYEIELTLQVGAAPARAEKSNIDATEYTFYMLDGSTGYKWRIRAFNSAGKAGTWSAWRNFTSATLPTNPHVPGEVRCFQVGGQFLYAETDFIDDSASTAKIQHYCWWWKTNPTEPDYDDEPPYPTGRQSSITFTFKNASKVTVYVWCATLTEDHVLSTKTMGSIEYDPHWWIPSVAGEDPEGPRDYPVGTVVMDIGQSSFDMELCESVFNWDSEDIALKSYMIWDAGTETWLNHTTQANNATANDFYLMMAVPTVGDKFYYGLYSRSIRLKVNVGTAGVGTWTLAWKVWTGSAWTTIPQVTDPSYSWTVAGTHSILFHNLPSTWTTCEVNSVTAYYVCCEVTAYNAITTQPLGTQAWGMPAYIQTDTRPYYVRSGAASLKVSVPNEPTYCQGKYIFTKPLSNLCKRAQGNAIFVNNYLYFATFAGVAASQLQIHRIDPTLITRKTALIPQANPGVKSMITTDLGASTYMFVLTLGWPTYPSPPCMSKPQLLRMRLPTMDKVVLVPMAYAHTASPSGLGQIAVDPNTPKYIYFGVQENVGGDVRHYKIDGITMTASTTVLEETYSDKDGCICDGNYVYTSGGTYIIKRSKETLVIVATFDTGGDLITGLDYNDTYIFASSPDHLYRILKADFTTNVTKDPPVAHSFNSWLSHDATYVYCGTDTDDTDGEIYRLQIADWTTTASKILGTQDDILSVGNATDYVYGVRSKSDTVFTVNKLLKSDWTTNVQKSGGPVNLSLQKVMRFNVMASILGENLLAFTMTESTTPPVGMGGMSFNIDWPYTWQEEIYEFITASTSRDAIEHIGFILNNIPEAFDFWIDPISSFAEAKPKIKALDGNTYTIYTEEDMEFIETVLIEKMGFHDSFVDNADTEWTEAPDDTGSITFGYQDIATAMMTLKITSGAAPDNPSRIYRAKKPTWFYWSATSPRRTLSKVTFETRVKLPSVTEVEVSFGLFNDNNPALNPTNSCIQFYLDVSGSGNWFARNYRADVTSTDTGVAATTSNMKFKFVWQSGAIYYYINDVLVATHTTNIPTVMLLPVLWTDTEAAAAGKSAYFDWLRIFHST